MKGIRFEVYPREGVFHASRAPSTIQEHGDKRNPRDELLLVDIEFFSSLTIHFSHSHPH
jgi:hypothetical protein